MNPFHLQSALYEAAYRDAPGRDSNWYGSIYRSEHYPAEMTMSTINYDALGAMRAPPTTPVGAGAMRSSTLYGFQNPDISRVRRQLLAEHGNPYRSPHTQMPNQCGMMNPRESDANQDADLN